MPTLLLFCKYWYFTQAIVESSVIPHLLLYFLCFNLHHSFSFLRRKEKERLQEKETRKSKTTTKFNQKRVNSFHSNSTRFAVVSLSGCKWFYVTLNLFQGLIFFPIKKLPIRHTAQTKCVAVSFYYFNSKIHSGWSFVCVRGCIDAP